MTKPPLDSLVWDDYHEKYFTPAELDRLYPKYLAWMKRKGLEIEVDKRGKVWEGNVNHVVYHAYMQLNWEAIHGEEN